MDNLPAPVPVPQPPIMWLLAGVMAKASLLRLMLEVRLQARRL